MDDVGTDKFFISQAIHPNWVGHLMIARSNDVIVHLESGARGRFFANSNRIVVHWDSYPPEEFVDVNGLFVQSTMDFPDLNRLYLVSSKGIPLRVKKITVQVPNERLSVSLRASTSDMATFEQIFIDRDYETSHLPESVRTIVDLGANTGLASLFFGLRYPDAEIVAVEPDLSNHEMMVENVASLSSRVTTLCAAVWSRDGVINIHRESATGQQLGAWGIQVSETASATVDIVKCQTLDTIIAQTGLKEIDILKVDIEGAEVELFSCKDRDWLPQTRMVIIETHDRFRPGSESVVRSVLSQDFDELPSKGENLFFRRKL